MSKRMKLVPEDFVSKPNISSFDNTQQSNQIPKPNEDLFSRKERGAKSVLLSTDIPDDIKLQLYGSIMNVVNSHLVEIMNKPVNVKVVEDKPKTSVAVGKNEVEEEE